MLAKVIDDEERENDHRLREPISVRRSLSSDCIKDSQGGKRGRSDAKFLKAHPCNNVTSDQVTSRRSKSVDKPSHCDEKHNSSKRTIIKEKSERRVRHVPCPSYRPKKDCEEDELLSCRPTRDVEPEEIEEYYPAVPSNSVDSILDTDLPLTRENGKNYSRFLKCPACGWEDVKHKDTDEKNERRSYVPCSEYNKDLPGEYSACVGCDKIAHDDLHYQSVVNTDLSEYLKKYDSRNFKLLEWLSKHPSAVSLIKPPADSPILSPVESVKTTEKHADAEVQHSEDLKEPSKVDVLISPSIQTQVVQIDPAATHKLQFSTIKAQLELILSGSIERSRLNEFAESVTRVTKSVQSAESPAKQTRFSFESEKHEIGVNTVDAFDKALDNTVCVSGEMKKCVSIQTLDEKEEERNKYYKDDTMKEVAINVVDQTSKGMQSAICVSRGNSACRMASEKKLELGTTTSVHQVRSVSCMTSENAKEFKSNFVQCVSKEKLKALTRSESHDSVKHCIRDVKSKHLVEKRTQEFEDPCTTDTCPWNILHLSKNPIVAPVLQQLLQNILSMHEQRTQEYKCRLKENCLIDGSKMVIAIKEYIKMLESSIIRDDLSEFSGKFDKKSSLEEVRREPSLRETGTCITRDDKSTVTEENIFVVLPSVFTKSDEGRKAVEDNMLILEKTKRKHSMLDKKVCTHLNCKDVGISRSLVQLSSRDMEVQSDTRSFKDSVCVAKYEDTTKKVSVGTQKRDPILVRVIKCNESQPIVRSDKGTLTLRTDMNFAKRYTSKRVETCGRSTCIPSTVCRMSNEANLKSAFRKERDNEIIEDYDICDINCKGKMSYDWTDVTNVDILSNMTNSRIPVCMKSPRKYTYARSK
ncbi:uncharacterized protein LOC122529816 isoform X1 [Frieseomelitta varia]|uniref:uncharacterized protein LOC122529816 isoform X1 n=1 Tax=Frieseomelitta varia TaxID=561572 RepID=UPI001CB69F94|nr:uncharacterized protein LOC122529816 isoform X1 [Frieseomelitta varia]XP_043512203.1 uncharacterized protein LOC122529816 isoform X1 [Frieseomelitta varia]